MRSVNKALSRPAAQLMPLIFDLSISPSFDQERCGHGLARLKPFANISRKEPCRRCFRMKVIFLRRVGQNGENGFGHSLDLFLIAKSEATPP
jgi:hypothetical protein